VILCVGDSFTWGVGASDPAHSYPSRMQRRLAESGAGPIRVVNQSLPGRNSRKVLERLDTHLEASRPALVYALVGMNDQWSRPEPLTLADGHCNDAGYEVMAGEVAEDALRRLRE
jgi:lysophospholipase L1-like esterase